MKKLFVLASVFMALGLMISCTQTAEKPATASGEMDRTRLPILDPPVPKYSELSVKDVPPPPRFQVKAPEDAPNVVIVLIDDLGFDSIAMIALISGLEEKCDVSFDDNELDLSNFRNITTILDTVGKCHEKN